MDAHFATQLLFVAASFVVGRHVRKLEDVRHEFRDDGLEVGVAARPNEFAPAATPAGRAVCGGRFAEKARREGASQFEDARPRSTVQEHRIGKTFAQQRELRRGFRVPGIRSQSHGRTSFKRVSAIASGSVPAS